DVIDQHGRIAAGDLARELRLSSGAVTALVDRLERAGFARRVPDAEDRRRVLIEVTPVVHELSAQIYGTPQDAVAAFGEATDQEIEVLYRFQELSRAWLEQRLALVEQLEQAKSAGSIAGHPPGDEPGSG